MKTKIKQHEEKYWHIPKFRIGLVALFILVLAISYGYSFIFINEWKAYNISFVFTCDEDCNLIEIDSLGFIPQLIFGYILISLNFICLVALIKGGFRKLKSPKKVGLVGGLIFGLIVGLIGGLIGGLVGGLIFGLIDGLIGGLIGGLIFGLIGGLIGVLIGEFEK